MIVNYLVFEEVGLLCHNETFEDRVILQEIFKLIVEAFTFYKVHSISATWVPILLNFQLILNLHNLEGSGPIARIID